MVLKITPKQRVKINALVRRTCCNCRKGNCLLLDDGEEAKCVQLISRYGIYNVARQSEVQKLKQSLATSERRIKMIDKAIEELFEANISGKVSDERFVKMTDNYEKEHKELLELVADGNKKLQDAEHMSPTPEKLLNANESLLAKAICEAGNKGPKFGAEKAAKLREAAGSAQVIGVRSASNASLIKSAGHH